MFMNRYLILFLFGLFSALLVTAKPIDTLHVVYPEFVPNLGQWEGSFEYRVTLRGGAIFFEKNQYSVAALSPVQLYELHELKTEGSSNAIQNIDATAYRVSFLNANECSFYTPFSPLSHYYNYFLSSDSSRWKSFVKPYSSLKLNNLYDGVDLNFLGSAGNFKYEFQVAPYANCDQIQFQFDGVKTISLVSHCLVINTSVSRIVEKPPFAYQISSSGDTVPVSCDYVLDGLIVSFKLGHYDKSLPLTIDPVVVFSSFSGSLSDNWGYTATYDAHGNLYGGGISFGVGYPVTYGAYQVDFCDGSSSMLTDVTVSKFDSSGSFLYYSTYLGGSYSDIPHSLYVNDNDELFVFGSTGSFDFPVTPNAFDTSFNYGSNVTLSTSLKFPNGADIFVSKFSADGSQLLASSFVGGSSNDGINTAPVLRKNYADDNRGEILVDDFSNVYVISSTFSSDFPITFNAFDTSYNGGQDVCLFKMSQDLSQMLWSTYIGGSNDDAGYSIFLAGDKSIYLCGGTTSFDWPTTSPCLSDSLQGVSDGFVAHLSTQGDILLQSSYVGKNGYDQAYLIKGDRNDTPYIIGQTDATGSDWIYNAQYSVPGSGQFLSCLSPTLDHFEWSTVFGSGSVGPDISPTALLVDYCNNIYISGWGSAQLNGFGGTTGLPVTSDAFQLQTDGSDYYFISISGDASSLVYATFFGGSSSHAREHVDGGTSRFDRKGRIYQAVCAGCGGESLFPTTPGAWSETNGSSNCNLGVIKMDFSLPVVVADFSMPSWLCAPEEVHFTNQSQLIGSNSTYHWDFGDGYQSTEFEPSHNYINSGLFDVKLIVHDNSSCNLSDTLVKRLLVLANTSDTLSSLPVCLGDFVQLGLPPSSGVTYHWQPENQVTNPTISNPVTTPEQSTLFTLLISSDRCSDTLYQMVTVDTLSISFSPDTTICFGSSAMLHIFPFSSSNIQSIEWSLTPDFSNVFGVGESCLLVQPELTTTYFVRVSSAHCSKVHTFEVAVSDLHIQSVPEVLICFEDGANLEVIHDGGQNCSYLWQLDNGLTLVGEHPYISPEASTHFSVTVTNQYGCYDMAEGDIVKRIGTFPLPFEAWCDRCTTVQNENSTVFSTDYGPGYNYHWTPSYNAETPDNSYTVVHPSVSTTYVVQVTDSFNCFKTDSVYIDVAPLICDTPFVFIPNIFTPNSDGRNDVLYVRSAILQQFHFVIYSRWGQKVFETTDADKGWDGTFKGEPCQNGVYDYYFKGTCIDGQESEIKGNIMLVR